MSEHPNVTVINRMTKAVFENDRDTLSELFTDDMIFHVRGPLPRPGDHEGVAGFLGAMGALFELTDGDVKIEQLFCIADDGGRSSGRTRSSAVTGARSKRTTCSSTGSKANGSLTCG